MTQDNAIDLMNPDCFPHFLQIQGLLEIFNKLKDNWEGSKEKLEEYGRAIAERFNSSPKSDDEMIKRLQILEGKTLMGIVRAKFSGRGFDWDEAWETSCDLLIVARDKNKMAIREMESKLNSLANNE